MGSPHLRRREAKDKGICSRPGQPSLYSREGREARAGIPVAKGVSDAPSSNWTKLGLPDRGDCDRSTGHVEKLNFVRGVLAVNVPHRARVAGDQPLSRQILRQNGARVLYQLHGSTESASIQPDTQRGPSPPRTRGSSGAEHDGQLGGQSGMETTQAPRAHPSRRVTYYVTCRLGGEAGARHKQAMRFQGGGSRPVVGKIETWHLMIKADPARARPAREGWAASSPLNFGIQTLSRSTIPGPFGPVACRGHGRR